MRDDFAKSAPWPSDDGGGTRSVFVPVLLLALAILVSLAVQAMFLVEEKRKLIAASAALEPQELAAGKIRASLDSLASGTAGLAAAGNPGARVIVEQLRSRGITINAPASSASR